MARTQLGDDDLIALADQDDIWHPQKIEVLEMKIRDRDLVFGDAQVIDADGKTIANSWREMDRIPKHLSVKALLTGFTNVTGCMALFKAGLLANVLPIPDGVPVHDQWITLCAAVRGGYAPVSDKVIRYRIHGENAIGGAGGHSWTEKLRTNLQWAKAVHDSTLYARLNEDQKKFLDGYIAYMDARFQSALLLAACHGSSVIRIISTRTYTGFSRTSPMPPSAPWVSNSPHVFSEKNDESVRYNRSPFVRYRHKLFRP